LDRNFGLGKIIASFDRSNNSITIENALKVGFKVLFNGQMLDISKPVTVHLLGQDHTIYLRYSKDLMKETAFERGDPNYIFSTGIHIYFEDNEWIVEAL
jgi:hypothetical protein